MSYTLWNQNVTSYVGIMQWANGPTITNGWLGYGILLIVVAIVFLGTKRFGATTAHAFLASAMVATFVCGALTMIGVTSSTLLIIILMILMFAYIFSYHS